MSCQSCQSGNDIITDHPGTSSCDRNNCRCGSSKNCMYYNDSTKSHYNYFAVQGEGSVENPEYSCVNKAYDYYNENDMYGDHALGSLGAYGTEAGDLYGDVNYDDGKCSEHGIGQRDMCDECDLDQPDFYGEGKKLLMSGDRLFDEVDVGFNVGGYGLGVDVQRWLLWVAILGMLYFLNKRGLLPKFAKDILSTKIAGVSLLIFSGYLIAGYLVLSFFF